MNYKIQTYKEFSYIDEGKGPVMLLLHGLFGALSNWSTVIEHFSLSYRVLIPIMPIYVMPRNKATVDGLAEYITGFVQTLELHNIILLGNSLGGHVALVYLLDHRENVSHLVLTGSSGLFESGMGGTMPRRNDYQYIKKKVEFTFFSPTTASKELVDEVYSIVNDNSKALRIISMAKAACRHNLTEELKTIQNQTLLIWGLNDVITPPEVAHDFNRLIKNSKLTFIDNCGHAPMMEQPEEFNRILTDIVADHYFITEQSGIDHLKAEGVEE